MSEECKPDVLISVAPLSLRDYFAAAALMGLIAHESAEWEAERTDYAAAMRAYQIADAMLTVRNE